MILTKKLRSIVSKFRLCKRFRNMEQMKILVQSHITYGIIAWGGLTNNHMAEIGITPKLILKIILGKPYRYPSDKVVAENGTFDIRQLFYQ